MAGSEGATACTLGSTEGPDVWFKYTAPVTATINFNTKRLGPAVLSLHSGCPGTEANELACNRVLGGLRSTVSLAMTVGQMVWVRVAPPGTFELETGLAGSLMGRIEDATNGSGVSGAVVILALEGTSALALPVSAAADGSYSVGGLPPGTFLAGARDTIGAYLSEIFENQHVPAFGVFDLAVGLPVTVSAGVTTTLDFALDPAGRIAGKVTEAGSGTPIGNAHVTATDIYGTTWASANTLGDGTYDIGSLRTGTYYVDARKPFSHLARLHSNRPCSGPCQPTKGELVAVTTGGVTGGIDFELEPRLNGSIAGRVTDGVAGLQETVRFFSIRGDFVASAFPDAGGNYVNNDLEPGTHYVGAGATGSYIGEIYDGGSGLPCRKLDCDPTEGAPVTVPNGGAVTGIDLELELGGAIDGTIVKPGFLPFGTGVQVYDTGGVLVASNAFPDGIGGGFPVEQVPAGNYTVVAGGGSPFFVPELYDGGSGIPCVNCDPTLGQVVGVTAGATTGGVDFELAVGAGVSGRLRRLGTDLIPDASGVSIFDAAGDFVASATASLYGYELTGLVPGSYTVVANSDSPSIVEDLYISGPCGLLCEPQSGDQVLVSGTEITTGIDFDLEPCPGGKHPTYSADNHIDIAATVETCVDMRIVDGFHVSATGQGTLVSPVVVFEGGRVDGELIVKHP